MNKQPNTPIFIIGYLLLMIPTYVLPYFGSNSTLLNAFGAAAGMGMLPPWWAHVWCLVLLCLLAWARGSIAGRNWLPALPFLAMIFDMTPGLSSIPLIPTLLHLGGILCGVIGVSPRAQDEIAAASQQLRNRRAFYGAAAMTILAVAGSALFLMTAGRAVKGMAKEKTPATTSLPPPAAPQTAAPQSTPPPADKTRVEKPRTEVEKPKTEKPKPNSQAEGSKKTSNKGTTTRYINLND